jgi:hypothetical protein
VKTHFELQIHDTRLNYGNLDEIQSWCEDTLWDSDSWHSLELWQAAMNASEQQAGLTAGLSEPR